MNRWILLSLLLLSPIGARAGDPFAHSGTHEVITTKDSLTFRHFHDWDSQKVAELDSDPARHEQFLSSANDFAFVEVRDGDNLLFRSPSSALTHLWISPDGQLFVGLSNIQQKNPYQLIVWKRDGTVVHREHITNVVARFSPEQRSEFASRFPEADKLLSGRYFTHGDSIYLDHVLPGVHQKISKEASDYLLSFTGPHPYRDDDTGFTIPSSLHWFDIRGPDLSLNREGTELSLRSPWRKRTTITIQK